MGGHCHGRFKDNNNSHYYVLFVWRTRHYNVLPSLTPRIDTTGYAYLSNGCYERDRALPRKIQKHVHAL